MSDGSTDFPDRDVRVGTTEREAAASSLLEHLEAGRLDLDEYGERAARASVARTRGELRSLFTDLPGPDPLAAAVAADAGPAHRAAYEEGRAAAAASAARRAAPAWSPTRRLVPPLGVRAMMLMPFLALALLLAFHLWFFFLLIPLSGMFRRGGRRQFAQARYRGPCGPGWR